MPIHTPLPPSPHSSRRRFLLTTGAVLAASAFGRKLRAADGAEPIIDIHQHTNYTGRTGDELVAHQKKLGVTLTVLLPAGSRYGLAAGCGGNDTVVHLAEKHPGKFVYWANEDPTLPSAADELRRYLNKSAKGIGEQKFPVESTSPHIQLVAEIAREFDVPVLMHFQHDAYNMGLEHFHKILEKYAAVNFIGHAQTWWGNIDKNHDPSVMYPTAPVTPGGITDRLLSDYPNMYGDLSAGSGLNSMRRDEDHARAFLTRHQDKLLYGSDCNDVLGAGPGCQGAQILETVRRLVPNKAAERKILCENSAALLKIRLK